MAEKKEGQPLEDTQRDEFMVFQVGKEHFGINISYVNEIVMMQPIAAVPESRDYIKGIINLRGKVIPAIDVRIRFRMDPLEYTDRTCIIVIAVDTLLVGLIVEKIAQVNTIPQEDIVPAPKLTNSAEYKNEYVYGMAKIGNTVRLLLDPGKLIQGEDRKILEELQNEAE